jgi:hypothetical protein
MLSKCDKKHFKGFGSGFTEFRAKLDADTLLCFPSIADKTKHVLEKALKNKACSQRGVTWQTDAIG